MTTNFIALTAQVCQPIVQRPGVWHESHWAKAVVWAAVFLLVSLRENPFPGLFKLLEATLPVALVHGLASIFVSSWNLSLSLDNTFCLQKQLSYESAWFTRHRLYPWLWNDWLKVFHVYFPISNVSHQSNNASFHFIFWLLLLVEAFPGNSFKKFCWMDV